MKQRPRTYDTQYRNGLDKHFQSFDDEYIHYVVGNGSMRNISKDKGYFRGINPEEKKFNVMLKRDGRCFIINCYKIDNHFYYYIHSRKGHLVKLDFSINKDELEEIQNLSSTFETMMKHYKCDEMMTVLCEGLGANRRPLIDIKAQYNIYVHTIIKKDIRNGETLKTYDINELLELNIPLCEVIKTKNNELYWSHNDILEQDIVQYTEKILCNGERNSIEGVVIYQILDNHKLSIKVKNTTYNDEND